MIAILWTSFVVRNSPRGNGPQDNCHIGIRKMHGTLSLRYALIVVWCCLGVALTVSPNHPNTQSSSYRPHWSYQSPPTRSPYQKRPHSRSGHASQGGTGRVGPRPPISSPPAKWKPQRANAVPRHRWSRSSDENISYRTNPYEDVSNGPRRPSASQSKRAKESLHTLDKSPFIQHSPPKPPKADNPNKKPNILLIMTDDLDIELGSLNYMPKLLRLLGDEGAMFSNSYTSTPMCCPSRSSMLTGMYIHNHEVYTNNQNCSSLHWQNTHERKTFASYLDQAGYRTGYFGKYLNRYNGSHVPNGWRDWAGLISNSRYYNYTVNRNNRFVKYGNRYPQDYYPHVVTSDGIHFLRSNKGQDDDPFMLVLSYPSPHGPEDSAPEHSHRFFNSSDHHTASYNYAPNPDKQWILQFTDRMSEMQLKFTDLLMTKRLQTLQSVDESIEKVVNELKALGELDNTYIFFTSDHGYHLGQFGLAKGKSMPFEFDIKVPFLVRGPGVKAGIQIPEISLNIDLAPTFLDIAGVQKPSHMDGRSLLPLLKATTEHKAVEWRDSFLVESSGRIRDEEELQKIVQRTWQREKALAMGMSGVPMNSDDATLYTSKHGRFQEVCARHQFQAPCSATQKWFCVETANSRWRLKKCRPKQSLWRKRCICQSPFGLGNFRRLDPKERRRQRKFLKRHVNKDLNLLDKNFLQAFNNVHITSAWDHKRKTKRFKSKRKRKASRRRNKRFAMDDRSNITLEQPDLDFDQEDFEEDSVQAFVEEEELRDLEHQIIDINDELQSLEDTTHSNETTPITEPTSTVNSPIGAQCTVNANATCLSEQSDVSMWRNSKAALEEHILRLKQQLSVIKNIYSHLQWRRPNLDVLDLDDESKDYLYDRQAPPTHPLPDFKLQNEALIVAPEAHHQDQLTLMPISHKTFNGNQPTNAERPNVRSSFLPTNYLETTISMSNGHQLYPIPLSFLLDELMVSDNETSQPLCWCDKRVLRRLEVQKLRSERREERKMMKKDRLKRKLQRKQKKKQKLQYCNHPTLHCYAHDNSHWRTPPLWTDGYFCFCMSASNNTYWCLRTINEEHNFLYCEFITGLITYFDHHIDPYQLRNVAFTLSNDRVVELHNKLTRLRICAGDSCHQADMFNHKTNADDDLKDARTKPRQSLKQKIKAVSSSSTNTVFNNQPLYNQTKQNKKIKKMKRLQDKLRRKLKKQKKIARQHKYAALLGVPEETLSPSFIPTTPNQRFARKSRHRKHNKQKNKNRRNHKNKNIN